MIALPKLFQQFYNCHFSYNIEYLQIFFGDLKLETLLLISRHAYEVSEAGIIFDLFFILNLPLEACTLCISVTALS